MHQRMHRRQCFFCKRGLPSRDISANHMGAYFKYIVHVHTHTRTVNVWRDVTIIYVILKYAPYDWLKYRGMAIRAPAHAMKHCI